MIGALAALAYLASYGARTPLLALRGLLRLRNIVLVVAPAVAIGFSAAAVGAFLGGDAGEGAIALALVPAPLVASEVVTRLRGRMDLAGVLAIGTAILSLLLIGGRGAIAAGALFAATEAYAIAAMIANALPSVRDAVLVPLRAIGWIAVAVVIANAVVAGPVIDGSTLLAAAAVFASGTLSAALVALLLRREITAAVAGAGLRDPVLGIAFATLLAPQASGVALVYGVFCLVLAAVALRAR